jgi:hypothetical protein
MVHANRKPSDGGRHDAMQKETVCLAPGAVMRPLAAQSALARDDA